MKIVVHSQACLYGRLASRNNYLEDKSIAVLIIVIADPELANCMIDKEIDTGTNRHPYTLYNSNCHLKQYFKYLQYRPKAVKYSKKIIFNK